MKARIAILTAAVLAATALAADLAHARGGRPNRIGIEYAPPKTQALQPVYELARKAMVLEKIQRLLRPLRLPRRLLLKTEGCDGVSNAWYDGDAVTVCYEFLDDIWKNVPETTTPAGVTPMDAFVGPLVDVFLHEVGHAVFDLWQIPVLGREEDAADLFSVYIMLQFSKQEARRLIVGNAYQYKNDVTAPTVTMAMRKFADEHGTPSQRFFNVLCLAYGADPKLFADFASTGLLPKERAEGCEDEYKVAAHAMKKLIWPYVDRRLSRRNHGTWLPPIDGRPPRRPDVR